MSIVYLVLLVGVAGIMLAVTAQAVLSVSRRPAWPTQRHALQLVETVDRRQQSLPFVGQDRRLAGQVETAVELPTPKAA